MEKIVRRTTKFLINQPVLIFFVVFLIIALLFIPSFANTANLMNMLTQSTDIIIISCGMVFVVMNGGIDFSVTSVIGLGSVVAAKIMNTQTGYLKNSPYGWVVAVIAVLLIGVIIGSINGFAVVKLKMPSFIATMATQLIFGGVALILTSAQTINYLPKPFLFIEQGKVGGIPFPVILTLIVLAVAYYILHKTIFGRQLFAVGTNQKTSFISGVPVKRIIFSTFVICGFLAAMGSIVETSRIGCGMPTLGSTLIIEIIAALIIGGTSIYGGVGSIPGVALGVLFIIILNNSLDCLGAQWYVENIFQGLLVLVVAVLNLVNQNRIKYSHSN
jgi:ribose/xylose/arabinose/galactoside ABC-type transport system permease subunit